MSIWTNAPLVFIRVHPTLLVLMHQLRVILQVTGNWWNIYSGDAQKIFSLDFYICSIFCLITNYIPVVNVIRATARSRQGLALRVLTKMNAWMEGMFIKLNLIWRNGMLGSIDLGDFNFKSSRFMVFITHKIDNIYLSLVTFPHFYY